MKQLTVILQALIGAAALISAALLSTGRVAWRNNRKWWKKNSKRTRRTIAIIAILLVAGTIAVKSIDAYFRSHGRSYWDKELSQNTECHSFNDDKYRVYNLRTRKYTTGKVSWVTSAADGDSLAVYALPLKRGYINVNSGEIVIDAEKNNYRRAWVFSEGLAAVMKDDKIGFINADNEVVIPFKFHYANEHDSSDSGYLFQNGYCAMSDADGVYGLIDKNGNWAVEPAYDAIWPPHNSGYRVVVKDGKHGVIDHCGTVILPTEYYYIDIIANGFVLTREGCKWQVDFDGNTTNPFMFDGTYYLKYPKGYNENGELAFEFADYLKYEIMNSYGIMNRITGKALTPAIYSNINMLSDGVFEVQEYGSYNWHLIDSGGKRIEQ